MHTHTHPHTHPHTPTHTHTHQQIAGSHEESRNYSDSKIKEFQERVDQLKIQHGKFVSKVQTLDPSYKGTIPWQNRGYTRKRSHDPNTVSHDSSAKKLCSPLLEREKEDKKIKMAAVLADKALLTPTLLVAYSDSDSSVD